MNDAEQAFATLKIEKVFQPEMEAPERERLYEDWTRAVHHAMGWLKVEQVLTS